MGGQPAVTKRGTRHLAETLAEYPHQMDIDNEAFGKIKVCRKKQPLEMSSSQVLSHDMVLIVKQFHVQHEDDVSLVKQEIELKKKLNSPGLSQIIDFSWEFVGNRICGSFYQVTIVCEFCEFSLLSEIKKRRRIHNSTPKGSRNYGFLVKTRVGLS